MPNDAAVLLRRARQKARHVHKGHNRKVEGVAKAHKARRLDRGVNVETAGQLHRLVAHDAHRIAAHARKARHNVLGVAGHNLVKVALVGHRLDNLVHVIRHVGVLRHHRVQRCRLAVNRVGRGPKGRLVPVRQRQKVNQIARARQRVNVVFKGEVRDARLDRVRGGSAQLLLRHVLARHRLDHVGPRHKHVARVLHHHRKVGDGRAVHGPAGAGPHDQRQLRNHSRRHHVALKNVRVARQRVHALLNARPARVVEPDDGRAHVHRPVHHLAHLLRKH